MRIKDDSFFETDEDIIRDNRTVIFKSETDEVISAFRKHCDNFQTFPFISFHNIPSGLGVTSYLVNRTKRVQYSMMVVATKEEFDIILRDYGIEMQSKMCTIGTMEVKVRGRSISEIYFDNVPVDVISRDVAAKYMPSMKKHNALVVDIKQNRKVQLA